MGEFINVKVGNERKRAIAAVKKETGKSINEIVGEALDKHLHLKSAKAESGGEDTAAAKRAKKAKAERDRRARKKAEKTAAPSGD